MTKVKTTIHLTEELKTKVQIKCLQEKVSMGNVIESLLENWVNDSVTIPKPKSSQPTTKNYYPSGTKEDSQKVTPDKWLDLGD